MDLNQLLKVPMALPSIPKVIARLISEFDRPAPDLRALNQFISTDPALTARLLQLANSGYFKLSGQIHSVSEALAILGLSHVRALVVAAASETSLKAVPGIQLQQFWVYSLNVARVARALARVVRQNQQAAFTCGLLHAVGEITLHVAMPAEMATLNAELAPLDLRRARAEQRVLNLNYAHVSAGLAGKWLLPQTMIDALAGQAQPFDNGVYEPLAGIIHLAVWRARAREANLSEREMAVSFPGAVGEILTLDIDLVLQQDPIDWNRRRK
ncbi:MAG: hypothetical protein RLZZ591_1953 [Pseudomonadota bacterium]|jgi:HD-like signal output (HDOD) protein